MGSDFIFYHAYLFHDALRVLCFTRLMLISPDPQPTYLQLLFTAHQPTQTDIRAFNSWQAPSLTSQPLILRTDPPIIHSSVSSLSCLSGYQTASRLHLWACLPNALTPQKGVWSDHFPPLNRQEMRWCHDECGWCLFYTDELKDDCGFSVSQMLSMTRSENWAHSK